MNDDRQPSPEYLDFQIEVGRGRGRQYPVSVVSSPAGEARETMHFPFDTLALDNHLKGLQIALLRSATRSRRIAAPEEDAVQRFGRSLGEALLTGSVRSAFDASRFRAREQGKRLRLRLRIEEPHLAALPWEFLYDPRDGEYACLTRGVAIVRYLELTAPNQPMVVTPPLRILAMVAGPSDLPTLDVSHERQRVETALAALTAAGLVELTWLGGPTWRDLQRAMRGGPWHIFHFIGHGGFDAAADEGVLAMAGDDGKAQIMRASQVGRLLADHPSLRLVLLNACQGAEGSQHDLFSSTAATLVQRGIPAVVAMQYEITDDAAIEFSRGMYEALADGQPIDAAVAEARIGVSLALHNTLEWGTPVLFMRSADGALFTLARPVPKLAAPPALSDASPPAAHTAPVAAPPPAEAPPQPVRVAAGSDPLTNSVSVVGYVNMPPPPAEPPSPAATVAPSAGGWRRRRLPLLVAGGVAMAVLGVIALAVVLGSGSKGKQNAQSSAQTVGSLPAGAVATAQALAYTRADMAGNCPPERPIRLTVSPLGGGAKLDEQGSPEPALRCYDTLAHAQAALSTTPPPPSGIPASVPVFYRDSLQFPKSGSANIDSQKGRSPDWTVYWAWSEFVLRSEVNLAVVNTGQMVDNRGWLIPSDNTAQDGALAVDAHLISGLGNTVLAIGCRWNSDQGYRFQFNPASGQVALLRIDAAGQPQVQLAPAKTLQSMMVDNWPVTLELRCVGNDISGYLNGQQVVRATDGTYKSGPFAIGVIPYAYGSSQPGQSGAAAKFHNLVFVKP